jgi:hypothetical protein
LGDRAAGVRDPDDARQRDPRTRYGNNYKSLNLITTALGRNVYDKVSHVETAHDV